MAAEYVIETYASKRRGTRECPKKIQVRVRQSAGGGVVVGAEASALREDGTVGHPLGEVLALMRGEPRKLQVTSANVYDTECGIGTRLYEALAAEACKRGVAFESDSSLTNSSRSFWLKQVRKGRAVEIPHRGGDSSYRIDHPCEHKSLAGVQPCTHPKRLTALVRRVQSCLSKPWAKELLQPRYRNQKHPLAGHCAVAVEAVWVALARSKGYKGRVAQLPEGGTHWWLVSPTGCVLDPTAAQFPAKRLRAIYAAGRPGGPQGVRYSKGVPRASRRGRKVLERL